MLRSAASLRRRRRRFLATAAVTATAAALIPGVLLATPHASADDACQPGANGLLFVTETCTDPSLSTPKIDIDESRSTTDPQTGVTVNYRYVHGYFVDRPTAKFAFYFPAADKYQGRFFEETYPLIAVEAAAPADIAFALTHGGYAVATNNDGGVPVSQTLAGYRVNAAAAKFSREEAKVVYGASIARPRGYIYGASGGAYQTIGAAENSTGVWDGFVPIVPGVPNAIPSFASVSMLALRVLHDKLPQIAAAMQPGGSGNPFKGLTETQQSVLKEAMRMGLPVRGLWQYKTLTDRVGAEVAKIGASYSKLDPTYLSDFWSVAGYEGHDQASVRAVRVQDTATVVSMSGNVITLGKALKNPVALAYATLTVTNGDSSGKAAFISKVSGKTVTLSAASLPQLAPGTTVSIDNSTIIAMEYYPRHGVPGTDQYGWNQYRDPSTGQPKEVQRAFLTGPVLATYSGGLPTGNFHGKMIMLGSTMDVQAYVWSTDWYRKQAAKDGLSSNYRLWIEENADHHDPGSALLADPGSPDLNPDYLAPYSPELYQALLDLDAWVTQNKAPAATTNYKLDSLNQVSVSAVAAKRGGLQPTTTLTVHSKKAPKPVNSITVRKGTTVQLVVKAATPPGGGRITKVEWDFTSKQKFVKGKLAKVSATITATASHRFTKKGTYFVVVRISSQRTGNAKEVYTQVQNLARVRVVVN
jgi:hypothetical protein